MLPLEPLERALVGGARQRVAEHHCDKLEPDGPPRFSPISNVNARAPERLYYLEYFNGIVAARKRIAPMFSRIFLDHPRSLGESYFEHQQNALGFAGWMLVGSAACLIHALIPALCRTTGSRTVGRLYRRMIVNRSRQPDARMPLEPTSVDVWEHWEI